MYSGWNQSSSLINRFRVYLKEGYSDTHLRYALRSFDPQSIIKEKLNYFLVETSVEESEIKGFTFVKKLIKLSFLEED